MQNFVVLVTIATQRPSGYLRRYRVRAFNEADALAQVRARVVGYLHMRAFPA